MSPIRLRAGFRHHPDGKSADCSPELQEAKAKKADEVILATDPDREGEAISWHLAQVLRLTDSRRRNAWQFHEITQPAIEEAALDDPKTYRYEPRELAKRPAACTTGSSASSFRVCSKRRWARKARAGSNPSP
jgi:hypothetical protein